MFKHPPNGARHLCYFAGFQTTTSKRIGPDLPTRKQPSEVVMCYRVISVCDDRLQNGNTESQVRVRAAWIFFAFTFSVL